MGERGVRAELGFIISKDSRSLGGGALSSEFCPAWSRPQGTASDKFNMPEFAWYLTGHCELSVNTSTSVFLCELGPGGGMSWALRAARGLEALAEPWQRDLQQDRHLCYLIGGDPQQGLDSSE